MIPKNTHYSVIKLVSMVLYRFDYKYFMLGLD